MAKNRKRRKPPRRRTGPDLDLLATLETSLESPTPGPLLAIVGVLLSVVSADDDPAATLKDLVGSLFEADRVEASAAALAIATLTVDADLRRRVRRDIAERGHALPRWVAELHDTRPVDRAVEVTTVFRDADELLVGVIAPGGHHLTAVVRIDNEFGAVATDGYVVEAELAVVAGDLSEDDDPDLRLRDIPTADARARLTSALREIDLGPGQVATEELVVARPLIEWMLSILPEGGDDYVLQDLSDGELEEINQRFLDSPYGATWADDQLRPLALEVVTAASSNGIGDPLVWSAHNVASLLEPGGWRLSRSAPHLDRTPDLLRDLIRYGHAERGLRQGLTDDALAEVDARADAFLQALPTQSDGLTRDVPPAG